MRWSDETPDQCTWCERGFADGDDWAETQTGDVVCEKCVSSIAAEFLYEIAQRIDVARDAAGRKAA